MLFLLRNTAANDDEYSFVLSFITAISLIRHYILATQKWFIKKNGATSI